MKKPSPRSPALALAPIAVLVVATSGSAAAPAGPKTQVWMDVATHHMAGMPDMGGFGRFAAGMMGAGSGPLRYPDTRHLQMSGKYFDIALRNSLNPGAEAEQQIPAGLGLGKSLPLLPPTREPRGSNPTGEYKLPEGEMRMLFYWGCGATVRAGQPKVFSMSAKDGKVQFSGDPQRGRYAPDRGIDPDPSYALWPNAKTRKRASDGASLVGAHQITGAGVPASLKFDLQQNADFMPKIDLASAGTLAEGQTWSWQPVERARAYFLHAMGTRGKDVVIWSSSEVPDAGQGLVDYLTGSYIDRWLKEKVLLPTATTRCTIPKGIYTAPGEGSEGGGAFLQMIAYGPETNIAWPPKPADPKQPWNPEWNVRVRTKSTASAMLGMDLSGMDTGNADPATREGEKPKESTGKKLLKGLLRKF
ncbi:hypothetical protein [Lysobacter solisilvae (ex Woo and Kim 2020)]|uniref:Uncharacterized protein n=1 Tax=Agrilutibacter terrestris TaxID=2865112 RepID=A0A7H0FXE4_9GAMM|nr:hypothetical protein [Lysobacter terrestris]QNP40710.1 hypothetical protein H8B22_00110 [Lysobacter terrestris]